MLMNLFDSLNFRYLGNLEACDKQMAKIYIDLLYMTEKLNFLMLNNKS